MKLFMLINSLADGGAERVAIQIAESLGADKIFLLEKEVKYDVDEDKLVFISMHTRKTNPIWKTIYIPVYSRRLSKRVDKQSVVISFLERANYANILSSIQSGHRAVISVHMSQVTGRRFCHPYNNISKILYPKAHIVVCVSRGIAKELEKVYKVESSKIEVIYNPVDTGGIESLAGESLNEYEPVFKYLVLINVGRLTKPKGQWYLLRIFRHLKADLPELKLVILGDGELKDYLVSLSEELGLKTYVWDRDRLSEHYDVYFLGFQKNPFKFIAKAKLFVFSSLWEGFGNVIVESMACGVPVVSSDCRSGPREILAPDTDFEYQTTEPEFAEYGVLMPVFDIKFKKATEPPDEIEMKWTETLKKFLKDQNTLSNYSQKAKIRAMDFHISKIAEQWQSLLKKLEVI